MRIAILSDLHANLPAWNAVWLDLNSLGAGRVLCLGDVVGYGPHPADVLERVHENAHHVLLGNHDAALIGRMDAALFSDEARQVLDWTRAQLGPSALEEIRAWPLTLAGPGFRCAHGDLARPGWYDYVFEAAEAVPSWQRAAEPLLFVGHTHCPGLFVLGASGVPHRIEPQDFQLEPGKRYLVNPGSVGQPRDGDPRAAYAVYDTDRGAVFFRRVPYDLDAYRAAAERAGLPAAARAFLDDDPRRARPAVRARLSFRPAASDGEAVRGARDVETVDLLQRRVRRWRAVTALLGAALLLSASAGGALWWRHAHRAAAYRPAENRRIAASRAPANANLLPWTAYAAAAGGPIGEWTVQLGDRRRQRAWAEAAAAGEAPTLRLQSDAPQEELSVTSPWVTVAPGERYAVEADIRRGAGFRGSLVLAVEVERDAGAPAAGAHFVVKEPTLRRRDDWWTARETFDVPAGGRALRVGIRGRFDGAAEVRAPVLERKSDAP